jgi:hypothetical protein
VLGLELSISRAVGAEPEDEEDELETLEELGTDAPLES